MSNYIGRFAPSPSGPLHLGSLTCALASYFDAKANHGRWLVRIEDIDPPREQVGADKLILSTLHAHGLYADGEVRYQSTRSRAYEAALEILSRRSLSYRCSCTRKQLGQHANQTLNKTSATNDSLCNCHKQPPASDSASAVRLHVPSGISSGMTRKVVFNDAIHGPTEEDIAAGGDFIVRRKDDFFAYQLAVSVDDIDQEISHVVRGSDLLETTAKQIWLIHLLGGTAPKYAHIPVICTEPGRKLSKQNHAEAICNDSASINIRAACRALGLSDPPRTENIETLLKWGIQRWSLAAIRGKREVMLDSLI